jgi:Fe-Mn family superoxide dismutase
LRLAISLATPARRVVVQPVFSSLAREAGENRLGKVAGGQPILALDLYEHAYHMDYGAKAGDYVDE